MRHVGLVGAAAAAVFLVACGSGGAAITVDVEVSGSGVDQAIVELRDQTMTVELPWSTTVTVEDEAGTDAFAVIATNPTKLGELRCDADWNQAAGDGTWGRAASYQVSCGARVSFSDGGTVRLEPTGRSITFEEHAAALAEEAAALAAQEVELQLQREQVAAVDAARAMAAPVSEVVRVGDWDVSASGVLRDAEEYIESTTGTAISGRGVPMIAEITATYRGTGTGQPVDLAFELIGGLDQDRYKTFDVSCGAIPAPAYDVGETANGESVAFNVCWQVDAAETERAFVEVDQFGVGVDAEPVQLLLPESEGLPGAVADARLGPVQVGDQWLVEVTDVRLDDIGHLRDLAPDLEAPRAGEAYLWVEARVTNTGKYEGWPASSVTEWVITAADGITRYDDSYSGTCRGYPSPLTDRSLTDPPMEIGQTMLLSHCWEVAAEDLDGATLQIQAIGADATLDLGL